MRGRVIFAIVAAQVALLAFMAGQREWVSLTGRTVWLRTAPVDPMDPMRGAYVRLNYELSRVPREKCRDGVAARMDELGKLTRAGNWENQRNVAAELHDLPVYAILREGPDRSAEFVALSDRRPASGVFLRGRVGGWSDGSSVSVRYGIEALFLQQNRAKRLETDAWKRTREEGVRLEAELAVSSSGLAVLKSSRWEPLGITIETEMGTPEAPANVADQASGSQSLQIDLKKATLARARSDSNNRRVVTSVTVELKNHGEQPLSIWVPSDGRSFQLVPRKNWGESQCRWVGVDRERARPAQGELEVLKPGESRKVRLDLTAPAWALRYRENEKAEETATSVPGLEELEVRNWNFRVAYVPPTPAECAGLPGAEQLWRKEVQTRGFSPDSGWAD